LCHLDIEDDLENAIRAIQETAEDVEASVSLYVHITLCYQLMMCFW